MAADVGGDERAERHHAELARLDIVKCYPCQTATKSSTLMPRINLSVGEGDRIVAQLVLGESGDLSVYTDLIAILVSIIAYLNAHHLQRIGSLAKARRT